MSTPPHSRAQARAAEEKKDLVSRVKEWLTPASWLGSWGPAGHTHPPPTTPSEFSLGNGYSKVGSQSSIPGLPAVPVAGGSVPSGNDGPIPDPSRRLFQERTESRVTGGGSGRSNPHVGMELESGVFGTGQAGKGPDDSDESWVAEDTGMDESEPDSRQYRHIDVPLETKEAPHKSAPINSDRESHSSSHGLLPQDSLTEGVGSRQQTSTGLFQHPPYPFGPSSVISRMGPPATGFSSRLFTGPFTTSTPQLSPVQEETDAGATASSYHHHESSRPHPHPPSQPSSHPHPHPHPPSPSFSPAPFTTPLRLHTELSLARSPFQSPFYSGRTSFGGAASSQRLRGKRPRTESSPPALAPLRYSVTARPATGSGCAPSASQTARKILATLSSLSSPLADARRLPLRRGPPPEEGRQPAKRRRADGPAPSSALSPPPTTPLVTPTQASRSKIHVPVFVPNEKTLLSRGGEGGGASGGPRSLASKSPHTTQVLQFGVPSASTTHATPPGSTHATPPGSSHSTLFSGLTFTAPVLRHSPGASPPLGVTPPTQQASSEGKKTRSPVAGFKPTFHAAQLASVGGKMRGKPGAHYSIQREEICVNPSPLPPAVGLTLGKGTTTPSFSFAADIKVTHSTPSFAKSTVISTATGSTCISSVSMATASTALSLGSNSSFSFAAPKSLGSQSSTASVSQQDTSYSFSAPKSCSTKPTLTITPTLQPYPKLHPPPKAPPIQSTRPPPPLKNMSVVAALRQPEFQPVAPTSSKKSDVIDLTSDEEIVPAAGSWSCETCYVGNKPSDNKCVCCGAAKPGREKSQPSQFPSTGLQLGKSGGINLGGLKLPKPSVGLQLREASVSTGMKLPSGSTGLQVTSSAGLKLSTTGVLKIPSSSIVSGAEMKSDTTPQATASGEADTSKPAVVQLLTQFAPPPGSWTCDTCMLGNKPESDKCVACSEPKPGSKKTQADKVMLGPTGGFKLGTVGGLKQFAPPPGSWTCDTCMLGNKPESDKCVACSEPKPGSKKTQADKATLGPTGGFKLGSVGGLKPFAPPPGSWTCDTCMLGNKPESDKCVACSEPKPGSKKTQADKATLGPTGGFKLGGVGGLKPFAPPAGSWRCDTCMISNKPEASKCLACGIAKPGAVGSGKETSEGLKLGGGTVGFQLGQAGGIKLSLPGGVALGGGATQPGNTSSSGGIRLGGIKLGGLPTNVQEVSSGGVVGGGASLGSGGISLTLGDKKTEVSAGSSSESSQTPASTFLKMSAQSTSQSLLPTFPALTQPAKPNPLAGLKFGVAATSAQSTTAAGGPQLQFAAPLSLPKSSASSQPLPPFTFSAGNQQKTEPSDSKGTSNVFTALTAASQQKSEPSNSKISSFVFSATKSGVDSTSNSPFPIAGSASAQGGVGVFGAKMGSGLQFASQSSVGSQQTVAAGQSQLLAPQSQLPAPPPSVFTSQTVQLGGLFTGTQQQSSQPTPAKFQFHAAGALESGLGNPTPSLAFGGQTQSVLTTSKLSFGGGVGGANQPGPLKLQFGGSQPQSMFPAGNSGMGSGPGGTQAANTTTGFNFNASGGMNFNFGAGASGGNPSLFTAGSNSDSGSTSGRVIKKARRRKP